MIIFTILCINLLLSYSLSSLSLFLSLPSFSYMISLSIFFFIYIVCIISICIIPLFPSSQLHSFSFALSFICIILLSSCSFIPLPLLLPLIRFPPAFRPIFASFLSLLPSLFTIFLPPYSSIYVIPLSFPFIYIISLFFVLSYITSYPSSSIYSPLTH